MLTSKLQPVREMKQTTKELLKKNNQKSKNMTNYVHHYKEQKMQQ